MDAGPSFEPGRGSVARNSARLLLARVIGNVGFLVAVLVLARTLGPAGRGTLAFLVVSAIVIARVAAVGVTNATMVFAGRRPEDRDRLLANLLVFAAVGSAALGGLAAGLLALLGGVRPDGIGTFELAVFIPGTIGAALVEAGYFFLIGTGRFRQQALITASAPWLYAGALLLAAAGPGLTVPRAVAIWVVFNAVWALFLLVASARGLGLVRPSGPLLRESLAFGVRSWAGGLARFLNFRLDQILMGFLASEAALGIYAVAVNGAEVLLYLPAAVSSALVPVVVRAGPEERSERALRVFRTLAVLVLSTIVVAALAGPPLIPAVFGEDFRGAADPFLWLLPGALGFAAIRIFSSALIADDAPGRSSLGFLVAFATGLALDIVLIPLYGAEGAAVAASAAFLAGGAASLLAFWRRARFPWAWLLPRPDDARALRAEVAGWSRRGDVRPASGPQ